MLAKVVAHAPERREAAAELVRALRDDRVDGVVTNAAMLVAVLESGGFLDGATTTGFLDEHPELLAPRHRTTSYAATSSPSARFCSATRGPRAPRRCRAAGGTWRVRRRCCT